MDKVNNGEWSIAFNEVKKRFIKAKSSPRFSAYILVGVIFLGGMGIWLPASIYDNITWLDKGNHFTYSTALIFMLAVEALITMPDPEDRNNEIIGLGLIAGTIAFIIIMIGFFSKYEYSCCCSLLGTIMAILLFIASHAHDVKFFQKIELSKGPTAPVGPENLDPSQLVDGNKPKKDIE